MISTQIDKVECIILEEVPEYLHYDLLSYLGEYSVNLSLKPDSTSKTIIKPYHNSKIKVRYSMVDDKPTIFYLEEINLLG